MPVVDNIKEILNRGYPESMQSLAERSGVNIGSLYNIKKGGDANSKTVEKLVKAIFGPKFKLVVTRVDE